MAFGVKYRFWFDDKDGQGYLVDILKDGYTGSVIELDKMGFVPVRLTWPEDDDKYRAIVGSEAVINLFETSGLEYKEFLTAKNRDYKIQIYKRGEELNTNWNFDNWDDVPGQPDDYTTTEYTGSDVSEVGSGENHLGTGNGSCNFYNTDANWCSISNNVMTSGKLYHIEIYQSYARKPTNSDIIEMGAGGTQLTINSSSDATTGKKTFVAECDGSDGNIKIKSSTYDSDFTLDYFSVKEYSLIWSGFVVPDMYEEPYAGSKNIISLKATDGLGDLTNFPYGSDQETPYTGSATLISVIADCLSQTGLDLDIWSSVNIFETSFNETSSDDPLAQAYLRKENFWKDINDAGNYYDVLERILKPFGTRIIQADGVWKLLFIHDLKASYSYRVFNSSGTYQSNSTEDPVKAMGSTIYWRDKAQLIQMVPAWRSFNLIQNLNKKDNIVLNGSFKDEYWTDDNTPLIWTKSTTGTWLVRANNEAFMNTYATALSSAKYIKNEVTSGILKLKTTNKLLINISNHGSSVGTRYARVTVDDGTTTYYLQNDGTWSTTASQLSGIGLNTDLETDTIPVAGDLTIYLYEAVLASGSGAYVYWKDVSIKILDYYPESIKTVTDIDSDYAYQPEDIEIYLGDLYGTDDEEIVSWGGILKSTGETTSLWHFKGETTDQALLDHLIDDLSTNYGSFSYKLTGDIKSSVLGPGHTLKEDIDGTDYYFLMAGFSWDLKHQIIEGSWVELKS